MDKHFWKGKKVLITGHTGFKGSWLVMMLSDAGAKIAGYSKDIPTHPSVFESCKVSQLLEKDYRGDIADFEKFKTSIKEFSPEIVFHLAAQPLVRLSYSDPFDTYQTNVMGTLSVLMAANECPSVSRIINITTDKCYENKEWAWGYRETDRLGGHDPYSSSKACAEIVSASIRDSFLSKNNKVMATVRAGNVIGGGDWAQDRIIPDFFRAYKDKIKLQIRNPYATRPWQHVMEPLDGYITLAEKGLGDAWNFGPNDEDCRNVEFIVSTLHKLVPEHKGIDMVGNAGQPHEANFLKLDCSKVKSELKWHPRFNVTKALEYTADWYQSFLGGKDMRAKSLEQINAFYHTK
ncbi:MAG TPA: CDP-glucose 4,6-dehydratase [Bacteriovoracaceae bacterium]|nr:CDP-glucose 4,6-dehydratase [Bacteriovoracaceae bacterium]